MNIEEQKTTANKAAYTGNIPNTPLRFILSTTKPHIIVGIFAVLATVITQALGASISLVIGRFVDAMSRAGDLEIQLFVMQEWSVLFFVYSFVLYAGWRITGFLVASLVVKQNVTAYKELTKYIVLHSHSYFIGRFAGSISNKIANAGDGGARFLEGLVTGVLQQAVLMTVLGFVLITVSPVLSLAYFGFILFSILINFYLVKWRRVNVIQYSKLSSRLRGETVDLFSNIQAARQYTKTKAEVRHIYNHLDSRAKADLLQWQQGEIIHIASNGIALLMTAMLLIATYFSARTGTASVGDMVIVMIVSFRVAGSLSQIGDVMNRVIRFHGEVEEGLEDILFDYEITDVTNAKKLITKGGQMEWKNVIFEFDKNRVFDEFNLLIKSGQRVGLVGPSGAGKTTFVSLLLRQHDINAGFITIEGQDISQVTQDSLRQNIAVIPQEPMLFHRSIRENIAYGNPYAADAEIIEVAQKAQAHDFIISLPEGYDTLVGERGVKLSGGQKQRVAIARAMLKNAPILVLDEATSALDSESEVLIQKALHELMEGKTVIAVAHRLSTLREMDRIIVLEAGKIVEDGNHSALTKAGGTYARLWEHQAGGFLQE